MSNQFPVFVRIFFIAINPHEPIYHEVLVKNSESGFEIPTTPLNCGDKLDQVLKNLTSEYFDCPDWITQTALNSWVDVGDYNIVLNYTCIVPKMTTKNNSMFISIKEYQKLLPILQFLRIG